MLYKFSKRALVALLMSVTFACSNDATAPVSNNDDTQTETPANPKPDTTRIVLQNLGLVLAPYNAATGRAGDLRFDLPQRQPFFEFAFEVKDPQGNPKALPHYTWLSDAGRPIVAAIDGTILWIEDQDGNGDYELLLAPSKNSTWWVSYDHVVHPAVSAGATVKAGAVIAYAPGTSGNPSVWEFMVGNNAEKLAYCPIELVAPQLRTAVAQAVDRVMTDWMTLTGNAGAYAMSTMSAAGCRAVTIDN